MSSIEAPNLLAAFRTTTSGGGSYTMTFKFPTMQAMHAADDEWHQLAALATTPADPRVGKMEADLEAAKKALRRIWAAATLVTEWLDRINDRDGTALGGPQWFELGRAIADARSTLSQIEGSGR